MEQIIEARNGASITDGELVKIAVFKLRESANRMLTLAHEAQSEKVRGRLVTACEHLIREEKRFSTLGRAK